MDEAERCGRVGYIYNSHLIAVGSIAELQQLPRANPEGTVRVKLETVEPSAMLDAVRAIPGVREATIFGRSIHALVETSALEAMRAKLPGATIEQIQPSLEDVFVTLTYQIATSANGTAK
jgi:ABC-2 type transport system ATP-binding protein